MPFLEISIDPNKEAQSKAFVVDDERRFVLHVFYVKRTESWYCHLDMSDGTSLISGRRLTTLDPITDISDRKKWPRGYLSVFALTDEHRYEDADKEALGSTHFIMYLPFSQLSETIEGVLYHQEINAEV